jgi:hypothetical protein
MHLVSEGVVGGEAAPPQGAQAATRAPSALRCAAGSSPGGGASAEASTMPFLPVPALEVRACPPSKSVRARPRRPFTGRTGLVVRPCPFSPRRGEYPSALPRGVGGAPRRQCRSRGRRLWGAPRRQCRSRGRWLWGAPRRQCLPGCPCGTELSRFPAGGRTGAAPGRRLPGPGAQQEPCGHVVRGLGSRGRTVRCWAGGQA